MPDASRRELEQLIDERVTAVRRRDSATLLRQHDDQVLTFPCCLRPPVGTGRPSEHRWTSGSRATPTGRVSRCTT